MRSVKIKSPTFLLLFTLRCSILSFVRTKENGNEIQGAIMEMINTRTAREMALTDHNLSQDAKYARCFDGSLWIWSDVSECWKQIDKDQPKGAAKAAPVAEDERVNPMQSLLTIENARDWKTFVAEYVRLVTSKKSTRDAVSSYQVCKSRGGKYQIKFNGSTVGYAPMDAETLYSWMERLPLSYLSREADEIRIQLFDQAKEGCFATA